MYASLITGEQTDALLCGVSVKSVGRSLADWTSWKELDNQTVLPASHRGSPVRSESYGLYMHCS
jgi:hypothetical protein